MKSLNPLICPCLGSTVVGERGQVVIPKNIRDKLGLKKGSTLIALQMENGPIVLLPSDKMHGLINKITKDLKSLPQASK